MDPITIFGATASVINIIDILGKCIGLLDGLNSKFKTADMALLSLTSQLRALSAALVKIHEWTEMCVEEIHHQLIMDLKSSADCCQMLASKIHSELTDLQKRPGGMLSLTAKTRFTLRKNGISELQSMVDRQTSTLTLLLTACNSKSLAQQQQFLGKSSVRKRIDSVQRDATSLCSLVDSASFLSRETEKSSKLSLLFDFDDELLSSKPYKDMIRKTVKFSIRSQKQPFLSGSGDVITTITSTATGAVSGRRNRQDLSFRMANATKFSGKILLLGQGESSKTTFLKQMQSVYTHGINLEDREMWRNIIYDNLVSTFQALVKSHEQALSIGLAISDELYDAIGAGLDVLSDLAGGLGGQLPSNFSSIFKVLYSTGTFQAALSAGRASQVPGDLKYWFLNLERLCAQDFVPDNEDILHARVRTTGIFKHVLNVDNRVFHVFDVGGERSERKKWINVFENAQIVLFFVSMSCFDEALYEDGNTNRMSEALALFESIANSEWFTKSRVILCFTRMDAFKEKIRSGASAIQDYVPEYEGQPMDDIAGKEYFTNRFAGLLLHRDDIDVHYLDATNTDEVSDVLSHVFDDKIPADKDRFLRVKKTVCGGTEPAGTPV